MSWLLDVLGVRGPWESKKNVRRVVGSEGMNLGSWAMDSRR